MQTAARQVESSLDADPDNFWNWTSLSKDTYNKIFMKIVENALSHNGEESFRDRQTPSKRILVGGVNNSAAHWPIMLKFDMLVHFGLVEA